MHGKTRPRDMLRTGRESAYCGSTLAPVPRIAAGPVGEASVRGSCLVCVRGWGPQRPGPESIGNILCFVILCQQA